MKKKSTKKVPKKNPQELGAHVPSELSAGNLTGLLANLGAVILEARQQAFRAVDVVQVRTCWIVGRHIVEFEQGGKSRAAYGKSGWLRFRPNSPPSSERASMPPISATCGCFIRHSRIVTHCVTN